MSLIAATGLRIDELLALRWSSLDMEVGALTVRESVFEGKFQAPKTQPALRTIPLGAHAVKALKIIRRVWCAMVMTTWCSAIRIGGAARI